MSQYIPTELGTKSIRRLLFEYAVPAIIAMTAASLYNIVDSIFIGHIGPNGAWGNSDGMAISGLALTFPLMNISIALGAMVGVGASTVISVRLGQREYDTAQHVLGNTVVLNIVLGAIFMAVCLYWLDPILALFGASEATLPYARDYMTVILLGNVISHSYFGLNAVLRSAGHPEKAMYCTILTVVINALLDPLFIFNFNFPLGFAAWRGQELSTFNFQLGLGWGIKGAATATILSQLISLIWQFKLLSNKNEMLHLHRGIYGLRPRIIRQIIAVGMSPFLMNLCACLVVLIINKSMKQYGGDTAIAAYGIVNRVVFLFIMMVMGLNQGMQPIVGYNWGARQNDRVWQTLRLTILCAEVVVITGFIMGEFFPNTLTHLFTDNLPIIAMADRGFRIDVMMFPFVGIQMVIGNFFQSIGHAGKSIFQSITRQMLFLIPGLILLPPYFGLDGVWLAIPVSDMLSFFVSTGMLWWLIRKVNDPSPILPQGGGEDTPKGKFSAKVNTPSTRGGNGEGGR